MRKNRFRTIACFLAVALLTTLLVSACGQPAAAPTTAQQVYATREPAQVVRFVFAPDPLWDFMNDTGIVAKYEDLYNMKMVNTSTWDEVAWFVGGHADIASLGTMEVPEIAQNSGKDFTSFAKYNAARDSFIVRADSPYKSIEDLKGKRIAVNGPGSVVILEGAMLKDLKGLDFEIGKGDFDLYIQEMSAMGPTLLSGEVEAALGAPEFFAKWLASGELRFLREETPLPWEFYRANYSPDAKDLHVMSNLFVATTDWVQKNPKAVQFFLAMWQEGLDQWHAGARNDIILQYPQHFAVETEAESKWLQEWMDDGHDWFVKSITLDETWIKEETNLFSLLRKTGFMPSDAPDPKFAAIPIEKP